jgi:GR25 family glycosyltransferase involved in LPS biosynthesis
MKMQDLNAYVLGLEEKFRGNQLLDDLAKNDVTFEVVYGISQKEVPKELFDQYVDQKRAKFLQGRELTFGEFSCALGHLEMIERFLDSNLRLGLFLEDDAIIDFGAVENILAQVIETDRPFVLQLGGYFDSRLRPSPFPVHHLSRDQIFQKNIYVMRCLRYPTYAHGYLLSRNAAEFIVKSMRARKIDSPADFPFAWRNRIPFYISILPAIRQAQGESFLQEERNQLESLIKRPHKISRRFTVIYNHTLLPVIYGKKLGLSGRDLFIERIVNYWLQKFIS